MQQKRLDDNDIIEVVKLRGLGYSQLEIAHRINVSERAVQYQLKRINKRAMKEGDNSTFILLLFRSKLIKLIRSRMDIRW